MFCLFHVMKFNLFSQFLAFKLMLYLHCDIKPLLNELVARIKLMFSNTKTRELLNISRSAPVCSGSISKVRLYANYSDE